MEIDQDKIRQDIAKEVGIEALDPEEQDRLIDMMMETLLKEIYIRTMEKLGEKKMKEYEEMMDRDANNEELLRFLKENIENYEAFLAKIIEDFKREMKAA